MMRATRRAVCSGARWGLATGLCSLVMVKRNPIGDAALRNQSHRAAVSVACNIAESCAYDGAAKKRFLRTARGSALEVAICYETAGDLGEKLPIGGILELAEEIVAVMTKLVR